MMSLMEAVMNVVVGCGGGAGYADRRVPGVRAGGNGRQNLAIGLVFTVVSIVRSYTLGRLFEAVRTNG